MAQLQFQLDDDLVDAFVRLQQAGHEYTLDTILLIQILRKLDALGFPTDHDPEPGDAGIELVPSAAPAPRPNPLAQSLVDSIRGPNAALMAELAEQDQPTAAAAPEPSPSPQPAAQPAQQPAPQPRPVATPVATPVARPVQPVAQR